MIGRRSSTDCLVRIARNTQLFIQHDQDETGACDTIDPFGGSYDVEWLKDALARRAWENIEEIEDLGGMAKAIEAGIPRRRSARSHGRSKRSSGGTARPWRRWPVSAPPSSRAQEPLRWFKKRRLAARNPRRRPERCRGEPAGVGPRPGLPDRGGRSASRSASNALSSAGFHGG
ncbi:MAG: hypothetical protein CSB49_01365 [Proteobacteria bacterium]|nr:MAG: hypothetical protein CSB49_01365 [Pseudomonadota bacterium]